MTISDHINEQILRLNLEHLTPQEYNWIHAMRNLAMWAYIAKARRELKAKREAIV